MGNLPFREIHLDFHTGPKIPDVGSKFSKENFQKALKLGHVDSITVFSKCHHGFSYHPTKVGTMHPSLKFDLLKAEIEACHEIGVRAPVYLSAGLDQESYINHPEWAIKPRDYLNWKHDPEVDGYMGLCFNSPYIDYLCAQVEEVVQNYDADEIFMDICGVNVCYCDKCRHDMYERGINIDDWDAVYKFAQETYMNYTKRIRAAIDKHKPGLPLFHNGGHIPKGRRDIAHTNTHLELESLPTGGWGYDHFPMSAAYARTLDMDFLGMTGKFHTSWADFGGFKHPNALIYETALSIANGARCSIGDQLHPCGDMDMATYDLIGKAYARVEEREEYCKDVTHIADIALLAVESISAFYNEDNRNTKADTGAGRMLLEGHYLFDVIDIDADFSNYKVIILPDTIRADGIVADKLKAFVAAGGKVFATGESALDRDGNFVLDFGCKHVGRCPYNPAYFRPDFEVDPWLNAAFLMRSESEAIDVTGGTVLGQRQDPYFNRNRGGYFSSHFHTCVNPDTASPAMVQGKDGIYMSFKIFEDYANKGHLILRKVFEHAMDTLLGDAKTIEVGMQSRGVVTLTRSNTTGNLVNHLLYATPIKRGENTEVIEDVVVLRDVPVKVKADKAPKSVMLVPEKKAIPFAYENGAISYTIPELDVHAMVEISF